MKKRSLLYLLAGVTVLASCSAPKQAYYFDHYDYNAGKRKATETKEALVQQNEPVVPVNDDRAIQVDEATLVASANEQTTVLSETKAPAAEAKSYKEMTKAEKKEFRRDAKKLIKTYINAKKSGDDATAAEAAKAMDKDLRFAAIFGAVGIVAMLIGGDVFYVIGAIALIIGVVFFVMWLTRQ